MLNTQLWLKCFKNLNKTHEKRPNFFGLFSYKDINMTDEENAFDLPENTIDEMVEKIRALAWQIRSDWTDPRGECRKIDQICTKLKGKK
jgi:hypothetical protein